MLNNELLTGQKVDGENYCYIIEDKIGKGAFSKGVYKCHRVTSPMVKYAIKFFDATEAPEKGEKEAKILQAVQGHPHIVQIHDWISNPKHCFLVMDLAEKSLRYSIMSKKERKFSTDEVIGIGLQIAGGLTFSHRVAGLAYHGDIKPENILIFHGQLTNKGFSEVAKIGDFGISLCRDLVDRLYESFTDSLSRFGTPGYVAPEIGPDREKGYPIDNRVDAYSFGVTLRELLIGIIPTSLEFDRTTYKEKGVHIPKPLELLIESCREVDPRNRPSSFEEILTALNGLELRIKNIEAVELINGLLKEEVTVPFIVDMYDAMDLNYSLLNEDQKNKLNEIFIRKLGDKYKSIDAMLNGLEHKGQLNGEEMEHARHAVRSLAYTVQALFPQLKERKETTGFFE